jgi:hypothetical protein
MINLVGLAVVALSVAQRVVRTSDETGAVKKVTGRSTSRRVRDNAQVEDRKLSSPTDEQLSDLSKPLPRLDASLRPPG